MKNLTATMALPPVISVDFWYALVQFVAFPIIAPHLVLFDVISVEYKLYVLLSILFVVIILSLRYVQQRKWSWSSLGIHFNFTGWLLYLRVAIAGSGCILLYGLLFNKQLAGSEDTLLRYSILGSLAQTFLYQSWLTLISVTVFRNLKVALVINTVVFVVMHYLIYPNNTELLLATCIGGPVFTYMYWKYPNFFLVALLHMSYNAAAVLAGIIT